MPGFSIVTNISSLLAQENLNKTNDVQTTTIRRLTSGLRINSSADDAAGLAIANRFRSDISVLRQGIRNAADGLSTLQTIDGGLNNVSLLIDRARTLATQSASGTFTGDRNTLNSEFQSVLGEIDRQAQAVGLDPGGTFNAALSVFIGGGRSNNDVSEVTNGSVQIDLSGSAVNANRLGLQGRSGSRRDRRHNRSGRIIDHKRREYRRGRNQRCFRGDNRFYRILLRRTGLLRRFESAAVGQSVRRRRYDDSFRGHQFRH